MTRILLRMLAEDDGQDLIEYSLLAALISVVSLLAISSLGSAVNQYYGTLATLIP